MEIHAPRHPILTLKEALVHLCIVTIGILIALSFEGALEWVHHRQLVREARQLGVSTFALWRLGLEDPGVWDLIGR